MPATAAPPWTLAGLVATSREDAARLDLAAPAAGLVVGGAAADHLLGLDLRGPAGPPADHWMRGADLTAIYEPEDRRRLRATAMWRPYPAAEAAWELVVSAQTSLLHADATLAVVSDLTGDAASWTTAADRGRWTPLGEPRRLPAEAAAVLVRRRDTAALVAVHPQDPRGIAVATARGRARIECTIFPAAIEKGVILRSRALAAVGPAADAEAWAAALCATFAASPPFLDT
ncbi:MAG: hypothetical protein ACKOZU_11145 [Planctomycetaceae bacterium]